MKIAVLGTGMVGRALAARLAEAGHDVVVGTRDVEATFAKSEPDAKGVAAFATWQQANAHIGIMTMADAGARSQVIVNATAGAVSVEALGAVGKANLAGKVILDLAVPLDYSQGRPPKLAFGITDSLGEQIQRAFPDARVVKSLNTMHVSVMVNPSLVPGRHNVFVAGNDDGAKRMVSGLLTDFGWPTESIIDLGGIEAARTTEAYVPLLFKLIGAFGPKVNINVAHD